LCVGFFLVDISVWVVLKLRRASKYGGWPVGTVSRMSTTGYNNGTRWLSKPNALPTNFIWHVSEPLKNSSWPLYQYNYNNLNSWHPVVCVYIYIYIYIYTLYLQKMKGAFG